MPEELKKALVDFVMNMIALVQNGVDQQLPLVLQDIVGAAILSATVWWWAGIGMLLIGILLIWQEVYWEAEGFLGIPGVLSILVGIVVIPINWYSYIYATRFPRLVILDYLRGLL